MRVSTRTDAKMHHMETKRRHTGNGKRRTTVSLPAEELIEFQRIAKKRKVTLNSLMAKAVSDGLRTLRQTERSEEIMENYRKAFSGLSEEERMLLDGIILQPVGRKRK